MKEGFKGGGRRRRNREPEGKKAVVTKAEGERAANFAACLCHQHPVGTTDVQMMSCRKGIGREGGASGAREDGRQAGPRAQRGRD